MELKYVGPKPIISHTGIEFDKNKEDKFVYINFAIELIKALSHEYFEDKTYFYEANSNVLTEDEVVAEIKKYCPNIHHTIEENKHKMQERLDHDVERAHDNCVLGAEDKCTLENNIAMMKDYMIQRAINKSAYYCIIEELCKLLVKDHIDYIIVPMHPNFVHVLHSAQGVLIKQKRPVDTDLQIYAKDGALFVKLDVVNKLG